MNQLYTLEMEWNCQDKVRALSDEDYAHLNLLFEGKLPAEKDKAEAYYMRNITGSIDDLNWLVEHGLECTVKRVRGMMAESLPTREGKQYIETPTAVVNIVIPSPGLFEVRTLAVIENECTDVVHDWLLAGWRIVAVCPPNDTRRPTYILGHRECGRDRRHAGPAGDPGSY